MESLLEGTLGLISLGSANEPNAIWKGTGETSLITGAGLDLSFGP